MATMNAADSLRTPYQALHALYQLQDIGRLDTERWSAYEHMAHQVWQSVLPQLHEQYSELSQLERQAFRSDMKHVMQRSPVRPINPDGSLDHRTMVRPLRDIVSGSNSIERFSTYEVIVSYQAAARLQ